MEGTLIKYMYDPTQRGILQFQFCDVEMVTMESLTYTSLKDLLPESPPSILSPTNGRKDSWREIPMKDPLLQHAAWAYLQPTAVAEADQCFSEKMKNKCFGLFDCFTDVILGLSFHRRWNRNDGQQILI
uniref:Putative ovule protein n=1 Tax=Solanum chacoense TaxID=4108 RepID=A0A0V0GRT9_SOLCH